MSRVVLSVLVSGAVGLFLGTTMTRADAQSTSPTHTRSVSEFPDLVAGLKASPGCLGAEAMAAKGGRQFVIMAWFKDKRAVEDWYHSKMHREAVARFFPSTGDGRRPLSLIKDEKAPIMVIASVTPSEKPAEGQTLAVSQIAIEMYTPVPGGLALGHTFAPEGFEVPGLARIPSK